MTLAQPNPKTRYPAAVASLLPKQEQQYTQIDIGARCGMDPLWAAFREMTDFIGFEPEPEECSQLNQYAQQSGQTRQRYYPVAIAGRDGAHPFYVTQFPFSSGLYKENPDWMSRFPFTTLNVRDEITVEAITLDRFCADEAIDHVDFIKIDVEGAEYDVLAGAQTMLTSQKVLGIKTEFWWDPIVKGQPSFAEIDILLRNNGFRFFDLDLHRYARSVLPAGPIQGRFEADGSLSVHAEVAPHYGQSFTGDALYFRDPIADLRTGDTRFAWDRDSLLRLCGLLDVFNYGDCALEILEAFRTSLLADVDVDPLMDAVVPPIDGRLLSYAAYRDASIQIRQHVNQTTYNLSDWAPPLTGYQKR